MNPVYVVKLTLDDAEQLGIVKCRCGHVKKYHYRPTNCEYCFYCTCECYLPKSFIVGTEIKDDNVKT